MGFHTGPRGQFTAGRVAGKIPLPLRRARRSNGGSIHRRGEIHRHHLTGAMAFRLRPAVPRELRPGAALSGGPLRLLTTRQRGRAGLHGLVRPFAGRFFLWYLRRRCSTPGILRRCFV